MLIHKQCLPFRLCFFVLIICNDIWLMQYAWNLDAEGEEPTSIELNDQPHYEIVDDEHQGTMTILKMYVCNWQTFSFTSNGLSFSPLLVVHVFHIMLFALHNIHGNIMQEYVWRKKRGQPVLPIQLSISQTSNSPCLWTLIFINKVQWIMKTYLWIENTFYS